MILSYEVWQTYPIPHAASYKYQDPSKTGFLITIYHNTSVLFKPLHCYNKCYNVTYWGPQRAPFHTHSCSMVSI